MVFTQSCTVFVSVCACVRVTLRTCVCVPSIDVYLRFNPSEHAQGPHTTGRSTRAILPADSAASPACVSVKQYLHASAVRMDCSSDQRFYLLRRNHTRFRLGDHHIAFVVEWYASRNVQKCTAIYKSSGPAVRASERMYDPLAAMMCQSVERRSAIPVLHAPPKLLPCVESASDSHKRAQVVRLLPAQLPAKHRSQEDQTVV